MDEREGEGERDGMVIFRSLFPMCVRVCSVCTQLSPAAADHLLPCPDAPQYGLLQLGLHVHGLLEGQAVHALKGLLPLHGGENNMGLFPQ